jgi:hypothetical protein
MNETILRRRSYNNNNKTKKFSEERKKKRINILIFLMYIRVAVDRFVLMSLKAS